MRSRNLAAVVKLLPIGFALATTTLVLTNCFDGSSDTPPSATPTVEFTTATPTSEVVAPTQTFPPALGTPSNIDTSNWPTFSSPLGFELQYPPDWTLDIVSDSQMRILDPAYKKALDEAIAAGHEDVGLPPLPGASQFSVIADISPGFDVDYLIGSCGNDALRTTFLGRAAIHCPGTGTLTDTLSSAGHSYWVEFPPGHTMLVGGSVISEDAPDLAVVEAILSTFRFTPSP